MRFFLVSAVLATAPALADERFDKLDYDQDRKLSKAEAAGNADLIKGFDRFDRNKDGKLSEREYAALLARDEKAAAGESAGEGSTAAQKPSKPKAKTKKETKKG